MAYMSDTLEGRCAQRGLKLTGQRRTVLKVLEESGDHPSVEQIYERARALNPSISMATVYRTLNLLAEFGIAMVHDFGESFARYEIYDSHHDHLIDVETGKVVEFSDPVLEALKQKIARDMGYELVDHRLDLYARKIRT